MAEEAPGQAPPAAPVVNRAPPVTATRKPKYEDHHASASVVFARARNLHHLASLSTVSQFKWLHRLFLVVDKCVEQHRVYKLFGGSQGFMICTNVAEDDPDHATTLYGFIRHLLTSLQHLHLPGGHPLDLVLAVESGPMGSGLLGTSSLTYQLVGRPVAVVTELVQHQPELSVMVCSGFYESLDDEVAVNSDLRMVGRYQLVSAPGQVGVYTPDSHKDKLLYSSRELFSSSHKPQQPAPPPSSSPSLSPSPQPAAASSGLLATEVGDLLSGGKQPLGSGGGGTGGTGSGGDCDSGDGSTDKIDGRSSKSSQDVPLEKKRASCSQDYLLRFENADLEERYAAQQVAAKADSDAKWSVFNLMVCLAYLAYARAMGSTVAVWQVLQFHLVPAAAQWLKCSRPELYRTYYDEIWLWHRVLLLLLCSLPGSFVFSDPFFSLLFSYGTLPVLLEVLSRRLRFHAQLSSSVVLHVVMLFMMGLQLPGSPALARDQASFMVAQFLVAVVVPCTLAYCWDLHSRRLFKAQEQASAERASCSPCACPSAQHGAEQ